MFFHFCILNVNDCFLKNKQKQSVLYKTKRKSRGNFSREYFGTKPFHDIESVITEFIQIAWRFTFKPCFLLHFPQLLVLAFGGLVFGRPQELRCPNGDPFYENANTVDENVSFVDLFFYRKKWNDPIMALIIYICLLWKIVPSYFHFFLSSRACYCRK